MDNVLGKKIKRLRKKKKMTQKDLQEALGYKSTGMISQVENGSRGMSIGQVKAVAKILDVHPATLLSDNGLSDDDMDLIQGLMAVIEERGERYKLVRALLRINDD